jgi:hypothetical protein
VFWCSNPSKICSSSYAINSEAGHKIAIEQRSIWGQIEIREGLSSGATPNQNEISL